MSGSRAIQIIVAYHTFEVKKYKEKIWY